MKYYYINLIIIVTEELSVRMIYSYTKIIVIIKENYQYEWK